MIKIGKKSIFMTSLKLNNPQTSPKTYWAIIESCFSGRKIPIIPPLSVKGKIVTNFKEEVISKAFDKIWIPGLIFKFKSFEISGNLLEVIKNFLSNRFLRVVLNGKKVMLECRRTQF